MPYRFTPGPFSGPAPLLHPTPPSLHADRSGPVGTVRSVTHEATRVIAEQERVPAPDPGRYHPQPFPVSGGQPRAGDVAGSPADAHHAVHVTRGAKALVPGVADGGPPDQRGAGVRGEAAPTGAPRDQVSAEPELGTEGSAASAVNRVRVEDNGAAGEEEHHNEVVVAGRVTAEPRFRELPSGDHLATWRICVARHPSTRFRGRRVDSITCVSFDEGLHGHLRGWRLGDVVDVRGALRRRTWRGTAGPRSVCEVEATSVRFVRARRKGER